VVREVAAMNVKLDPKDESEIEALARQAGKDSGEILRELVHELLLQRREKGAYDPKCEDESCYDAALRAGLIGCIHGGPSDMSTNPKYMEGFGED
jgi:hypothetical protein